MIELRECELTQYMEEQYVNELMLVREEDDIYIYVNCPDTFDTALVLCKNSGDLEHIQPHALDQWLTETDLLGCEFEVFVTDVTVSFEFELTRTIKV